MPIIHNKENNYYQYISKETGEKYKQYFYDVNDEESQKKALKNCKKQAVCINIKKKQNINCMFDFPIRICKEFDPFYDMDS